MTMWSQKFLLPVLFLVKMRKSEATDLTQAELDYEDALLHWNQSFPGSQLTLEWVFKMKCPGLAITAPKTQDPETWILHLSISMWTGS